ncbi:scaffolding protein [Microbacterium phage Eleri]|uniref:Scaffolding protein n=4 Tax=Elerivirus eleri TaxID=2560589 RepID=A0A6N0A639_9CAUD|nr:scaffolding protein [Microbacterium phage Eleri]AUX83343.1 scaffolding protein [Microbacterium phage Eleri]AXH70558.1 scaffolding protein [Microbacterium phage ColaCorta]AXH70683.1 scaffolding protein [Microbacterium phage Andromedas]QKO02633.1 scaffolding protein [Microbacterium phage Glamour]
MRSLALSAKLPERQVAEMATTDTSSDSTTSQDETSTEDNTNTEEQATEETSGQAADGDNTAEQDDESSDDGQDEQKPAPKPKSDPAKQALQRDLSSERKAHKASKDKVSELETQVAELTPKAELAEAWEAKYTRLEAFLQALPGSVGKALDSMSFTKRLFESEDKIEDIIKDWNKANPSATSQALGAGAGDPSKKGPSMNDILRAARG